MPEMEMELVTKEWLQSELRSASKDLIILDCRSSNEFLEGHIRSAVNFSIPSMMLRRLAAGKIDLLATVKSRDLKQRIQSGYNKVSTFVLYNDSNLLYPININTNSGSQENTDNNTINERNDALGGGGGGGLRGDNSGEDGGNGRNRLINPGCSSGNNYNSNNSTSSSAAIQQSSSNLGGSPSGGGYSGIGESSCNSGGGNIGGTAILTIGGSGGGALSADLTNTNTINVLHRRLKQDGCHVVCLQDGFSSFRDAFPEWCDEDNQNQEMESSRGLSQADQLMGLRSLRISTPHSDSACSSSTESSDCESTQTHYYYQQYHHNQFNEAPVEIVPGLFLGNASHSGDSDALQKYNIKYILNVTPNLPNVFERSGEIQYLQIPITDHYSQNLAVWFPKAIEFIEEARSKGSAVLVHCLAGVSRSVTVTLAYLMHTKSLCLNDAFTLVRDRKPDVSPNFHFMEQLHSFEQQIRISPHRTTSALVSSGTSKCESCPRATLRNTTADGGNGRNETDGGDGGNSATSGRTFSSSCICTTNITDCKCMQTDFLTHAKATGVSPDSGIEFDRWTPSSDGGLK